VVHAAQPKAEWQSVRAKAVYTNACWSPTIASPANQTDVAASPRGNPYSTASAAIAADEPRGKAAAGAARASPRFAPEPTRTLALPSKLSTVTKPSMIGAPDPSPSRMSEPDVDPAADGRGCTRHCGCAAAAPEAPRRAGPAADRGAAATVLACAAPVSEQGSAPTAAQGAAAPAAAARSAAARGAATHGAAARSAAARGAAAPSAVAPAAAAPGAAAWGVAAQDAAARGAAAPDGAARDAAAQDAAARDAAAPRAAAPAAAARGTAAPHAAA
jgi:hypothetical protein